jgi:hypothetical protein
VSPRLSVSWAGLSPRLPSGPDFTAEPNTLPHRARQADSLFTSLVVAAAVAAAGGAACSLFSVNTADGARSAAVACAAVTGAVLLLRARMHPDFTMTLTLLVAGTATLSAAFFVGFGAVPHSALWMTAGITVPVAAAMFLGFAVPGLVASPSPAAVSTFWSTWGCWPSCRWRAGRAACSPSRAVSA